jgi:AAA15 family ATPase/GTPase
MLIQFNCGNFKSYREEFSLDMSATSIKEHQENSILWKKDERYLKTAAIYGANSSGKSNILEAFQHMKKLVGDSFKKESERKIIPLKRFSFDEKSKNMDSIYEVFFTKDEFEYQYGFKLDNKKIKEEWLYKRDFRAKNKYVRIFERSNQNFNLNEKLKNYKTMLEGISERTLLLSFLSNIVIEEIKTVSNWFLETKVLNFGDPLFDVMNSRALPKGCFNDKEEKKEFEKFLKAVDVGIESIRVEEIKDINGKDGEKSYQAFSLHKNIETGKIEEILLSEESSGTLKMISLYEYIKESLLNGYTLFVDELDAKLHPLLTKYIIQMFHDEKINKKNAQLIFTTHDINNLKKEIFRRDQIWFVEKTNNMSTLYSLAEYKIDDKKIRNDASYDKDYLGGRYGAIPILKEFEIGGE